MIESMIESDVNVVMDGLDEYLASMVSLTAGSRTLNKEQLLKLRQMGREKVGIMIESYVKSVALEMVPQIVEQVKLEMAQPVIEEKEEVSGAKVTIRRRRRTRAEIEAEMAASSEGSESASDND